MRLSSDSALRTARAILALTLLGSCGPASSIEDDGGPGSAVRFASLSTGFAHACGRTDDGRVLCWGANTHGQLGRAGADGLSPMPVEGLGAVTDLSCGADHTCVIADGALFCWGYNHAGQLGTGDTRDARRPTAVRVATGFRPAQVVAGPRNTCAVTSDQRVSCWGDNPIGILGVGAELEVAALEPVRVEGLDAVDQLGVGGMHACARSGGRVRCWGNNFHGQLGDGTRDNSAAPVELSGIDDAQELTVGNLHACIRRGDDSVWCWGINELLQLGASGGAISPTPLAPRGVTRASWIQASGVGHTCAGAPLFCWGLDNAHGELGDGEARFVTRPIEVAVAPPSTARLHPGAGFTCALLTDGSARCWGLNEHGQLGDGTTEDRLGPVPQSIP